jgi:YD repeat-containing protein
VSREAWSIHSQPTALTGLIDEAGMRFESTGYAYSSNNIAISSSFAGGADAMSTNTSYMGASLTTPLGEQLTFNYNIVQGALRASTTNQPCGTQCNESQQSNSYDSAGYLSSTTDFNNNVTQTTYDDSTGLLKQQVDAYNTTSQRTTTYTWNTTLLAADRNRARQQGQPRRLQRLGL